MYIFKIYTPYKRNGYLEFQYIEQSLLQQGSIMETAEQRAALIQLSCFIYSGEKQNNKPLNICLSDLYNVGMFRCKICVHKHTGYMYVEVYECTYSDVQNK